MLEYIFQYFNGLTGNAVDFLCLADYNYCCYRDIQILSSLGLGSSCLGVIKSTCSGQVTRQSLQGLLLVHLSLQGVRFPHRSLRK